MAKHLWEVEHRYYCEDSNYFASGHDQPGRVYKSWAKFIAEFGDSDLDYNLLFRWDWREGDDWELTPFNGDVNYRNGEFMLYWMGQRKGLYFWSKVEVCRADEPAIIEFLKPRLQHLLSLWAPLTDAPSEAAESEGAPRMTPARQFLDHDKLEKLTLFELPDGRWQVSHMAVGSDGWHVVHASTARQGLETSALDFLDALDGNKGEEF